LIWRAGLGCSERDGSRGDSGTADGPGCAGGPGAAGVYSSCHTTSSDGRSQADRQHPVPWGFIVLHGAHGRVGTLCKWCAGSHSSELACSSCELVGDAFVCWLGVAGLG
jgi:hypothetical protein